MSRVVLHAVLCLLAPGMALACSMHPGYADFAIEAGEVTPAPAAPVVHVGRIVRGFDDGLQGSCSGIASVEFVIDTPPATDAIGYEFELLAGALPQPFLPAGPVRPPRRGNDESAIVFYWSEAATQAERHEALDAVIGVRTVSRSGARSETVRVHLRHAGGVAS